MEGLTVFKSVPCFEGWYSINNRGEVVNDRTGKVLKKMLKDTGYYYVCLYKNKVREQPYIHKLLMQTFVPNPENMECVNHKDEDKTNNFVYINPDGSVNLEKSNLEWCTREYNNTYNGKTSHRDSKGRFINNS